METSRWCRVLFGCIKDNRDVRSNHRSNSPLFKKRSCYMICCAPIIPKTGSFVPLLNSQKYRFFKNFFEKLYLPTLKV